MALSMVHKYLLGSGFRARISRRRYSRSGCSYRIRRRVCRVPFNAAYVAQRPSAWSQQRSAGGRGLQPAMTRYPVHLQRIGVRLAPEERAAVERAAQASAMTLSDFCRAALAAAAGDALNGKRATLDRGR